jgi:hypothetical protein
MPKRRHLARTRYCPVPPTPALPRAVSAQSLQVLPASLERRIMMTGLMVRSVEAPALQSNSTLSIGGEWLR